MTIDEFKIEFKKSVSQNQNFIITIHKDPDGDAIGAQFALYLYLKHFQKNVRIFNPTIPYSEYAFLGLSEKVQTSISDYSNDIVFMLDFNEKKRAGEKVKNIFENCEKLICIDHHKKTKDTIKGISFIDTNASSVCEILYLLLKDEISELSAKQQEKFANCLYIGLIYDTNNFSNKNVSSKTFEVAKKLINLGADNNLCSRNIFENRKTVELKLLGLTLSTLEEIKEKKLVYFITTQRMLKMCNAKMEHTRKFSKEVRTSEERKVVIYFRELDKNKYRVALRSICIDVRKIAEKFGGGGHKLAAGFEAEMEFTKLKSRLLELINNERK
ncbi:MAG: bifunctional oligoribonuclease/PAP phosphatase NrnA [Candidatus Cloacimonetes bacterium]|nr:bifunctional oligoribonuclease/PAP phosphatase NrnA [Candidatus Cloacimonadota bacterium]MBL7086041.1 bifunctional oligoribonuclease/PAP phosphatase NrnA [Candidatus Cloacimonadota bacterium]